MDKSHLGIAALVAAVVAIIIGVFGIMEGSKALRKAGEALIAADNARPTDEEIAEQAKKAVSAELTATREKVLELVAQIDERIKELEKQAARVDILAEAKKVATANSEQSSQEMFRQVRDLQKEMRAGDVEAVNELKRIQAEINQKLDETRSTLNKKVDRWMESGVM
ncbi:MAG: hypothetical protein ACYSU0_16820 [Planctomycetota bacterium]|jgi:anthranilate/para-aminobenzoate synthase component I